MPGIELGSSCLRGKYFTHRAMAPAHMTRSISQGRQLGFPFSIACDFMPNRKEAMASCMMPKMVAFTQVCQALLDTHMLCIRKYVSVHAHMHTHVHTGFCFLLFFFSNQVINT